MQKSLKQKLLLVLILLSLQNTAQAFFPNKNLEQVEKKVRVDVLRDKIEVEILLRVKNPTDQPQPLQFFFPVISSASEEKLFIDAEGKQLEILAEDKAVAKIFDEAVKYRDYRFFKLWREPFSKLLVSEFTQIPAGETKTLKLKFEQKPDFVNDFFFSEIFLDDDIQTGSFELALSVLTSKPLKHFLTTWKNAGLIDRQEKQATFLLQKEDFIPKHNLLFFWSMAENPVLNFSDDNFSYQAKFNDFTTPPKIDDVENITFLIDQSGSMLGRSWDKTVDFMHLFLENLERLRDKKIRFVFFDEEVFFYEPEFQKNSFELRKDFADVISKVQPVGKTDLHKVLTEVQQNLPENHVFFLITDESETDFLLNDSLLKSPFITLNFAQKPENSLQISSRLSGGFYQQLFPYTRELVEFEEFWQKVLSWRILQRENLLRSGNTSQFPIFEVERIPLDNEPFTPSANFLTQNWAASRIADLLQKHDFSTENLDAILAIGRVYGVKNRFFNQDTARQDLTTNLQKSSTTDFYKEIFALKENQINSDNFNKLALGVPIFKQEEKGWQNLSFSGSANPDNTLKIAPFSPALKQLFINFPQLISPNLAINDEVKFCTKTRCLEVQEGLRSESLPTDLLFWNNLNPEHWANEFLPQAVKKGILKVGKGGAIPLDENVTRGEFLNMLRIYFADEFGTVDLTKSSFSDKISDIKLFLIMEVLAKKKIIKGYPDGTFQPNRNLSRAEAVKILLAINEFEPEFEPEGDVEKMSAKFPDATGWEKPWINEAARRNIVLGYPDGHFRPHKTLTKAEAAKLILKVLE